MNENQIQRGQQWLGELLHLAGVKASIEADTARLESEGSCWLIINAESLSPEQVQMVTGSKGTVLDAIQYLANTTLNLGQPEQDQQAYTVELDGYRARRQAELQAMAEAAAQQVRDTGQEFEMMDLSAAERRQIHTFLQAFEDLETYSRGREPDRRLVVKRASDAPDSI
ncbi:RNA-binding protein [Oculatella sp. LEGE 06141]|nr:R3H domain-containing nucleic acid-binding protein [Oculatella sp. LEGE 06141]MBE9177590.1 RNA-binding protein [Oculatella sp. LEGE 06141]